MQENQLQNGFCLLLRAHVSRIFYAHDVKVVETVFVKLDIEVTGIIKRKRAFGLRSPASGGGWGICIEKTSESGYDIYISFVV